MQNTMLSLLVFSIIFGVGPKIFGISAIDEILLFLYICFFIEKIKFKKNIYNIIILYFILVCLIGAIHLGTLNSIRYLIISISIFLYININNYYHNVKNIFIKSSFSYLCVYLAVIIFGYTFDLQIAYWQDNIWSGTAYAAFGCYFSVISILLLSDKKYLDFFSLYIYAVISILADSRLMDLLFFPIVIVFLLKITNKKYKYSILKKNITNMIIKSIIFFLIIINLLGIFIFLEKSSFQINLPESSLIATIKDFSSPESTERDADRTESNEAVLELARNDLSRFLFGGGSLTHQIEMRKYINSPAELIRPTGFPAVIFDGGIFLLFIIIYLAISTTIQILRIKKLHLFVIFGAVSLPIIAIGILPITNPLEMILFWLCIIPGSFPWAIANIKNGEFK